MDINWYNNVKIIKNEQIYKKEAYASSLEFICLQVKGGQNPKNKKH